MRRALAFALLVLTVAACEPVVETLVPVGAPRIDCQGVPPQQCQEALDMARDNSRAPLVELVVRCTAPPCTIQQGQTEARARFADGSQQTFGSGWSGAVPAPVPVPPEPVGPLPVEPVCLGVPAQVCRDMASSAVSNLQPGSPPVASITVRCTEVCTPTNGTGESVVVFADGTSTGSSWSMSSGGG